MWRNRFDSRAARGLSERPGGVHAAPLELGPRAPVADLGGAMVHLRRAVEGGVAVAGIGEIAAHDLHAQRPEELGPAAVSHQGAHAIAPRRESLGQMAAQQARRPGDEHPPPARRIVVLRHLHHHHPVTTPGLPRGSSRPSHRAGSLPGRQGESGRRHAHPSREPSCNRLFPDAWRACGAVPARPDFERYTHHGGEWDDGRPTEPVRSTKRSLRVTVGGPVVPLTPIIPARIQTRPG